ncbi:RagB/SusD family nutrient uptake outer membrane protein [Gelidibacter maritimus]|uniref:RagB/SusD family nutrient uptake outer membrane protein n=1 Tax=Gelidibacter maritimus TaxID=2761487 RepID=A0A7W2M3J6_9FLAO|nr:RagB/SusD family nutrient uptake outer membrane protein [Gelidibacter maritimus]MBA6152045.1 RagB/SusD family nutrient uptake outer membrane protein [Gelidibacter maritimus]
MKIKKIKFILGIFAICLINASCEDALSVSPKSEVKYDDLFSNKYGFKDQLTGVYTSLCSEDLYGANLTYGMMDALGQQYVWTQETGKYYSFNRFNYDNINSVSVIENVWSKMYNTIANTNILLKGLEDHKGILLEEEERIYKAEALALRAFLHFDLLRIFGGSYATGANEESIPYVKSISKEVTPFSTVSETINLIIADLQEAASLLINDPIKGEVENTTFLGNREFHLNYYAVRALLARAYLFKNDKSNAYQNAMEIINSGKFPWVARTKVTTPTRETRDGIFVTEGIFMLNNSKIDELTGKYLREGQSEDKSNLLVIKPSVLNDIFETDRYGGFDWRYTYYFETQKENFYGSTKLWQFRTMPTEYKNRQPLLSISEMYLIASECAPAKEEALNYFNTLRQHRGFDSGYDLQIEVTDKVLQNEIAKEYRKEFVGEGQWFFYCKRTDMDIIPNTIVPFAKSYYTLPIPDQENDYGTRN